MRLLFVHEVNYEKKVIFEMHEFPEQLAVTGHEIHFLHFPEFGKNIKFRSSRKKINGRVNTKAQIILHTPPTLGGGFIDRLISTFTSIPLIIKLLKNEKFDAVILYAVPTSGWQITFFAKVFNIPVIFRALDVSHQIRGGLTSKLVKIAEKFVYQNVTLISANNPELARYVSKLSQVDKTCVVNVPPLDLSHFDFKRNSNLREQFGIQKNDFLLVFMGTLFHFSGLITVLEDLAKSGDSNPNLKLMIVGDGELAEEIREKIKFFKLENNVITTGQIAYSELPEYFSIADAAINPFEKIFLTDIAFPHKVLQYLASGLPVISTRLNGLFGVIESLAGIFWVVSPEMVVNEAIAVKGLDRSKLKELGSQGKNFVFEKFNKEKATSEFLTTIQLAIDKESLNAK